MELCLYHPEFGYYMRGGEQTGAGGDYFTSSDLHPVFARLVARQATEVWEGMGRPNPFTWVEMGSGRGWFARDFLAWAQTSWPDFWEALDYVAVEPGEKARARVLERVADASLKSRLRVSASIEELDPLTGCFFSNELVDAFPVSIVTRAGGHLKEIYVAADGDHLREKLGPISDSTVASAVARYANQLEEGHRVEVNRRAVLWMRTVAGKLLRGFVLTIDYGDLAERLYTPDRPRGTLLAYRGHTASEDFFSAPGDQDLTAQVNFSALIDTGEEAGLELQGFISQEQFLMALGEGSGFRDLYDPGQSEAERLDARLKLKRLIFPGEPAGPGSAVGTSGMGSAFKVLIQSRGVQSPCLTGLRFQSVS